jgi:hypothetical protein
VLAFLPFTTERKKIMGNIIFSLFLVFVSCYPAIADETVFNLRCQSETGSSELYLEINEAAKTVDEQSTLFERTLHYKDGNIVTMTFGPGTQFVKFDSEYIEYGTKSDADPNGHPGAVNIVDRRTGALKWGALGYMHCEVEHSREQLPKKF